MTRGLYRFDDPHLGGLVAVSGGAASGVEEFLTRDTYVYRGHAPPYDDLPSEGQYKALKPDGPTGKKRSASARIGPANK